MAFIGLQAGHQNIQNNIDPVLATQTGAPGEMQFNVAVRDILGYILIAYGFQVQLDDANANSDPNTIGKDFDFYLALHAEGAPVGGAVSAPDPSVDAVNQESRRIIQCIENEYFTDTGIIDTPSIITNNMTFYYMWNVLTAKTPCGIIECGDLLDPHDSVILSDHRRVALGIAHGICSAFGIPWKGDPLLSSQVSSTQSSQVPEGTVTSTTTEIPVTASTSSGNIDIPITTTSTGGISSANSVTQSETPAVIGQTTSNIRPVKQPLTLGSLIELIKNTLKRWWVFVWGQ